jgi:hypothetical protein
MASRIPIHPNVMHSPLALNPALVLLGLILPLRLQFVQGIQHLLEVAPLLQRGHRLGEPAVRPAHLLVKGHHHIYRNLYPDRSPNASRKIVIPTQHLVHLWMFLPSHYIVCQDSPLYQLVCNLFPQQTPATLGNNRP